MLKRVLKDVHDPQPYLTNSAYYPTSLNLSPQTDASSGYGYAPVSTNPKGIQKLETLWQPGKCSQDSFTHTLHNTKVKKRQQ